MITTLKLALLTGELIENLSLIWVTLLKREREVVTCRERARFAGSEVYTFKIFAGVWMRFMRPGLFASLDPKIDVLAPVIKDLWSYPAGE